MKTVDGGWSGVVTVEREAGRGDDVCRAQFKPRHKNVIEYNTCGCYTLFSLQIFLETVVIEFCGSGSRAAGLSLSGGLCWGGGGELATPL